MFWNLHRTILIKFCGFIVHSKPNNMTLCAFSGKFPETRKIVLIFCTSPNVAPKPTDQSRSISLFRVLLKLSPASPFHFWPTLNIKGTLMLRVVHIRNKKRSDKHGILQTWSIVFVAMLLNQQEKSPRKYCYRSSLKSYRNKISFKLGYRAVNTRKYVRCARTFYVAMLLNQQVRPPVK